MVSAPYEQRPPPVLYVMKKIITLLGTLALLVLLWAVWLIASEIRDARIKRNLMSLKIGMSRAQVFAITGSPPGYEHLQTKLWAEGRNLALPP